VLAFVAALLLQGPTIPPPRGLVSDFANVVPGSSAARMEQIAGDVRTKSGGEIAVVTLPDLNNYEPYEVALRIGREWGVGPMGEAGDARKNLGAVILVVPKETAANRRGRCYIATGRGAEGFLTDGEVAGFCRAAVPFFEQRDYGRGLELLTLRVAEEFAREGNFQLDTTLAATAPVSPRAPPRPVRTINPLFLLIIGFIVISFISNLTRRSGLGGRRRGGLPGVIFIPPIGGGWGGGGWGGGGSWGGGGGGGGFGGFGGGGGFSGGGGGSDW
jgi:uncharacterized protein